MAAVAGAVPGRSWHPGVFARSLWTQGPKHLSHPPHILRHIRRELDGTGAAGTQTGVHMFHFTSETWGLLNTIFVQLSSKYQGLCIIEKV